jgi:hypothetical protein
MHVQRVQLLQHTWVACGPGSCDGGKVGQRDVLQLTRLQLHLLHSANQRRRAQEKFMLPCL